MLNCIAVDDEIMALNLLADNIGKVPYLDLVGKCRNAFDAIKMLNENMIDLVFTDIQMPGLTGLQFIEGLSKKPMIIFITAYKEFAVEGFSLEVVDYLLKPVPIERFLKACDRAKELHQMKLNARFPVGQEEEEYCFMNANYGLQKVRYKDIAWIEGLKDYVKIIFNTADKPLIVRSTVSGIEKTLPPSKFIRIHKSVILSKAAITSIRKNSIFIGDNEFSIGKTYLDIIDKLTRKTL
jgi:two-component system, LytTR family, response regulator